MGRGAGMTQAHSENKCTYTEAALREREADLARVQRIAGVGGISIDVAGDMRSWRSPEYLRLHGLPDDVREETHAQWHERVHPDDRENAERALFAALKGTGTTYDNEYRIIRPSDGAVRWVHARAEIERDETGKAQRLVGAHIDVTEQKEAQQALRESEERYRGVLNSMVEGFALLDVKFTIIDVNEEMLRLDGRARDQLIGRSFWDAFPGTRDAPVGALFIRIVEKRAPAALEHEYRWPDGRSMWIELRAYPTSEGGVAIFWHDISARKRASDALRESEERLRSAVQVGGLGLWDWNVLTGEVHWSDEHYRLQDYRRGEIEPSYEAWAQRIHPDDREAAEAAVRHARDSGEEYTQEFRSIHSDGSIHWLSGRGRFFYDREGQPVRMIGAMVDTTERREAEERQTLLLAELQHRVRNILAVVRSVFTRTADDERAISEIVSHFTGRLDALARTQVLVTQSPAGLVDLEALVREEALSVDSAEDPRVTVNGPEVALPRKEAEAIGLAIHELTTNAIKYGALGQRGGALEISWEVNLHHRERRRLVLNWIEQGVPAVPVIPSNQGFGSELIREALPYRLGAETELEFAGGGVRCRISLDLPIEAKVIG